MIKKIKELPKIIKLILLLILSFFYVLCFNNFLTLKVSALDNTWIGVTSIDNINNIGSWVNDTWLIEKVNFYKAQAESNLNETTRKYYLITVGYYGSTTKTINFIIYYLQESDLANLTFAGGSYVDSGGESWALILTNKTAPANSTADLYPIENQYYYYNSQTSIVSFNDNIASGRGVTSGFISSAYPYTYFKNYIVSTNVPQNYIDEIDIYFIGGSGYDGIIIDGNIYNSSIGNKFKYVKHFDILTNGDTEAPILDFANIETPFEMWQGDTFNVPIPTAYDNVDGDISSNIQVTSTLNPNVVGNYTITYKSCDSSNNCTTATIPIKVKNPWVEINMTAKSAIIFWYKDFTQVLSPNAYCDSIDLQGSCFVQQFFYLGRWKYSKVNLNDLDTLLYENGGVYAPLDPAMSDYQNYEHINIAHTTSDFDIGDEYGILMFNESGANIVKLKYNQKYFDYRIYNSLNDTNEKEISYIDVAGDNQNTTDVQPPYTDLENPATVKNPTSAGLFSSFTTNTYGLTAIISAPLNLINQLTSKECAPINLALPYLDEQYLTLPCMNKIYETYFGSFFSLYQLITFGVVSYWVIVRLLNMIKDFKNPNHDEIEVLDL